ncbi:MAG: histidine kinase [Actinomycetota bacterium]|nr:histidine kinase [Actinomycetota bacterium]
MIVSTFRNIWAQPRVPDAPRRVWRDWVVAGALVPATVAEMVFRDDAGWKPGAIVISFALAMAVLWRRTYPLVTTVGVFVAIIGLDYVSRFFAGQPLEFFTSAIVLIVPYALFRWGSGRGAIIGLGVMLSAFVHFSLVDWTGAGDAIGGLVVLLFPAALGHIVRYQRQSQEQTLLEAKLREREQLARELHDTVAHHVSAIAIQAQAGQAVAGARPDAALEALAVIEREASRTLAEMRTMVSALRAGDEVALAPQPVCSDIDRLATSTTLPVLVERSGDLADLSPLVDRALFRLAQESITNATRHARHATTVTVRVQGEGEYVRLSVTDDGDARSFDSTLHQGFGLVGMTERANLLGGTLHAGPDPRRGWTVQAVLPKRGAAS